MEHGGKPSLTATVEEHERLHTSPLSGARGVFFFVEVLEDETVLGETTYGDLVCLHIDGSSHLLDVRQVRLGFPDTRPTPTPIEGSPPAELVPFLRRATGRGIVGVREHVVRVGDRFVVRPSGSQASCGVMFPEGGPWLLDVVDVVLAR